MQTIRGEDSPQPLGQALWDWSKVERVLVVRLRSIGDTVLTTPSLFALKRFLPNALVDILLEDWVAPVLDGFTHVDNVLTVARNSTSSRAGCAFARNPLRCRLQHARRNDRDLTHASNRSEAPNRQCGLSIRAPA